MPLNWQFCWVLLMVPFFFYHFRQMIHLWKQVEWSLKLILWATWTKKNPTGGHAAQVVVTKVDQNCLTFNRFHWFKCRELRCMKEASLLIKLDWLIDLFWSRVIFFYVFLAALYLCHYYFTTQSSRCTEATAQGKWGHSALQPLRPRRGWRLLQEAAVSFRQTASWPQQTPTTSTNIPELSQVMLSP